MVGNCQTDCPFCQTRVQVRVQRLALAPGVAAEPIEAPWPPAMKARLASHTTPTLTPWAHGDKNSDLGSEAGPPPPAAPDLLPARITQLFLEPGRFFAALERGRPRLKPVVGWPITVGAGAIQGLSWWGVLPGARSPWAGAAIGVVLVLAFMLYLGGAYRLALRVSGVPADRRRRLGMILGYAFVPMALGWIPLGGLPVALGTTAAAQARGLEHYLGLAPARAQGVVLGAWALFVVALVLAAGRIAL